MRRAKEVNGAREALQQPPAAPATKMQRPEMCGRDEGTHTHTHIPRKPPEPVSRTPRVGNATTEQGGDDNLE